MGDSTTYVIARIGGPESYSDKAARKFFKSAEILVCGTIRLCFTAVLDGKARGALVPVHNVIIGDVKEDGKPVKDLAEEMGLSIVSKHKLRVCLVLASYGKLDEVKIVYSKQPALDQCSKFSKAHKNIHLTDTFNNKKISDTSAAVEIIEKLDVFYAAAICDADAAKRNKVPVIMDPVADKKDNFTTFVLYEMKEIKGVKNTTAEKRRRSA